MKLLRKTLLSWLVATVLLGTVTGATSALAAEVSAPDVTVLQNDFIKITVDNRTGRFGVRTVEGQPIRKNDQSVDLMFRGDDPETSFTTFKINGTDYIFGNPYKFAANFFSEITPPKVVHNSNGTSQIETIWTVEGVAIKQILMLYRAPSDKLNAGNVNVRYEVLNKSGKQVQVGSRILLDTTVGGNDGPEFQIGTVTEQPLLVERKLVHEPNVPEEDRAMWKLPAYWVMKDTLDPTNPLATNVIAYGFNNFSEGNINLVDEMIVGHWNGLANTKWDYTPNGNLDFTRDTNDYGSADSAVAFYWQPDPIAIQGVKTFETVYGLGEIVEKDKVFSIRYLDTPQQLGTLADGSDYADEGVFDIIAEVENLPMYNMEHDKIDLTMTLESGLSFVKLDETGNVVRENGKVQTESYRAKSIEYRKPATPEEAENGIEPKYKPGDTVTVSFKVKATGRPWPTNKEYLLTASSPQTREKIEGVEDESVLAQYESSKANFILLPAVGEAVPTYAYGLAPKELFSTDQKLVTVSLTNLDAYTTGSNLVEPNFDLFFKEKATGRRYKVPVKESVLLQPTDDGFSGDMRISYKGGAEVDKAGNVIRADLGPELPIGEYQVEIDFKGDAGGDEEIAAMYDITTTQTFVVSDNPKTRIRQANILAIYKNYVDVFSIANSAGASNAEFQELNNEFTWKPFPSREAVKTGVEAFESAREKIGRMNNTIDPSFNLSKFLEIDALKNVPVYQYRLFDSEQEFKEFFDTDVNGDHKPDHEKLVVIRGMVKEVGTGADRQVVVETATEPAIINDAVAYKGKDLVFVRGQLDVFDLKNINGYAAQPFLDTLAVKGEGTLSVANSGFTFHKGEWTLDFFGGFEKTLGMKYVIPNEVFPESKTNPEDTSLNGSLGWAVGAIVDRVNPLRQIMIEHVYFNRHSLFAAPTFAVQGFQFKFNDYILRPGGVSFGGSISLRILEAEMRNVIFNKKGFVGVDAALKFSLMSDIGLIAKKDKKDKGQGAAGEIFVTHMVQPVEGVSNRYGIKFEAELKKLSGIKAELAFKQVADGRVLPDVIAFGMDLPKPIPITAATYLKGVRGALRELADTIAGGTPKDPFPLVIQAGVTLKFGEPPLNLFGDIDLTLKRTGIALHGKLDYSPKPDASDDELLEMVTKALLQAQWVTPWFVRFESEVDVLGFGIIVGKAGIFVGQNLEKRRIDFEGYIGAKVQVPEEVPVVGGMPLASVFFGLNNDKVWGSVEILLISLGITYYWGGGVEFGTDSDRLPEGMMHLVVNDPERGPRLLVIGEGIQTVATSWLESEREEHEIVFRSGSQQLEVLDNGTMSVGIGGIEVRNLGREHRIPMDGVGGNALIEMEYTDAEMPSFTLKDPQGKLYPVVFDNTNTNPNANAFTQEILVKDIQADTPEKKAELQKNAVDIRRAYIIVPQEKAAAGGTWTLTAVAPVETKLMNVPVVSKLTEAKLTKDEVDPNVFTASWAVEHARPGDTVNLYLSKEPVTDAETTTAEGVQVLDPADPGLLLAKDVPVASGGGVSGTKTTGSRDIDVTQVSMLGDVEDIRGLLQQGEYHLRVELASDATFGTMTSAEKFEIVDPLAPVKVSDVKIAPAGNGLFKLSFKPAAKKNGHGGFEHSYAISAYRQVGGKLEAYPNFGETLYTEAELAEYWNAATGTYENILIGGWDAVSTSDEVDTTSLEGDAVPEEELQYVGLEVGREYVVGVTATTLPTEDADKNGNYHFAETVNSALTLLPVPADPKLSVNGGGWNVDYAEVLTNQTAQTVTIEANQKNVVVEAFYAGESIGKTTLANAGAGSRGTMSFDEFPTDGTYAIELVSTNTATGDIGVRMLYLTVDTIAPMIYIDKPLVGERTENGAIVVSGTTNNDATVKVNGTALTVAEDGTFTGAVSVSASEPTVDLNIVARDGAGNENAATVNVVNDAFKAPVGLVLRNIATMGKGETKRIEPVLRVVAGKTAQGKPVFQDVVVPAKDLSKIAYSIDAGDAVRLSADGTVTGLSVGASLVKAEYRVSEGVTLSATAIAAVDVPKPTGLGTVSAYTTPVNGAANRTKIVVSDAGDMTGYQLVYRTIASGATYTAPAFGTVLSGWTFVPSNGEIAVAAGDSVVVAKQTSSDKKVVSLSSKLVANIWAPAIGGGFGGGFGGGGGMPTVNGQPANGSRNSDTIEMELSTVSAEAAKGKEIVVVASDPTVKNYKINIKQALAKQSVEFEQPIRIELPEAKFTVTPSMLANAENDVSFVVRPNDDGEQRNLRGTASSLGVSALGDGQGVTIETNLPASSWTSYVPTSVKVPEDVALADITAVLLQGEDGKWTPVPWKLDMEGGDAYLDVKLTGAGHLVFVRSAPTFVDVSDDHWASASIRSAAAQLLVLGKGEGVFDPNGQITRAEYPTMLLRSSGLMNKSGDATFTDVRSNDWFGPSIAIASELGIATGREDGSFGPQQTITRIEAMTMAGRLVEAMGLGEALTEEEVDGILRGYADEASIPAWARTPAALSIKLGIIRGVDQAVKPADVLTRAQAAAIVERLSGWIAEQQ